MDERGLPVRVREHGDTESPQIHMDEAAMRKGLRMTPQEFSTAMEGNNVIVDAVARIGTNEVTRLGATEKEMVEIAEIMEKAAAGKGVKEEVLALRSRSSCRTRSPARSR